MPKRKPTSTAITPQVLPPIKTPDQLPIQAEPQQQSLDTIPDLAEELSKIPRRVLLMMQLRQEGETLQSIADLLRYEDANTIRYYLDKYDPQRVLLSTPALAQMALELRADNVVRRSLGNITDAKLAEANALACAKTAAVAHEIAMSARSSTAQATHDDKTIQVTLTKTLSWKSTR